MTTNNGGGFFDDDEDDSDEEIPFMDEEEAIDLPPDEGDELLPEGEYPAYIHDVEKKDSKAGNPMLVVELRVWDGEIFRELTDFLSLSKAARFRLRPFISVAAPGHKGGPILPSKMRNREVRISVIHEEYNDEDTVRVQRYMKPDPTEPAPSVPVHDDEMPC